MVTCSGSGNLIYEIHSNGVPDTKNFRPTTKVFKYRDCNAYIDSIRYTTAAKPTILQESRIGNPQHSRHNLKRERNIFSLLNGKSYKILLK